jgi:hypothetical protein
MLTTRTYYEELYALLGELDQIQSHAAQKLYSVLGMPRVIKSPRTYEKGPCRVGIDRPTPDLRERVPSNGILDACVLKGS